jgi:hypothetical protein
MLLLCASPFKNMLKKEVGSRGFLGSLLGREAVASLFFQVPWFFVFFLFQGFSLFQREKSLNPD